MMSELLRGMIFIGSHQEWRRIKAKVGPRRVKYVVITCNQYVKADELEQSK